MEKLRQELKKEYLKKGKAIIVDKLFEGLEAGSGAMLEVNNVFNYLKYITNNSYIEKFKITAVIHLDNSVSISFNYNNLTLISFYTLKEHKNFRIFADLYNDKERDILYFISSIDEVEPIEDGMILELTILSASSTLLDSVIIK